MAKTDMNLPPPETLMNDLLIACALLTRLPVPHADFESTDRPAADAAWAYPIAGLLVASIASIAGSLALALGVPAAITALLILATLTICTGAMHEDGLADCADGFWGGNARDRRLEIMKDSHVGTYGVVALILIFALRWSALAAIIAAGSIFAPLVVVASMSRSAMVYTMGSVPNARDAGLSHMTGRPGTNATYVAAGIAAIAALLGFGGNGLLLIGIATIAMLACTRIANHKIGGQTGDVLGATQQISETAMLIAIASVV